MGGNVVEYTTEPRTTLAPETEIDAVLSKVFMTRGGDWNSMRALALENWRACSSTTRPWPANGFRCAK
jgi:formylglycine-generating enzyme required for sulfatase activity